MNITDTRSRIAVFIDFDNVEIGVKTTIGGQFDIGLVLEAIKERGEIVTKIAYSDWKRAGDYSRHLTQHAIRMVQRNLTPGGDKNGADITMALDALEMAFTHDHINAFVIVGGDSDFISLVEKLKQYGRKVIVVGGRQFTSATMQKNCHEFIAYENLVGGTRGRTVERTGKPVGTSPISEALPLVKRALKVLSEREVTPQLGLLKSTLLQLDSTFSEREYGAGSFRDFMEKVAEAGAVTLKHAGRSMVVESRDDGTPVEEPADAVARDSERRAEFGDGRRAGATAPETTDDEIPTGPMAMADGVRAVRQALGSGTPRWPMYVRQAKQFLKNAIENFDERRYGFTSVVDLLRAAAKEGVVRIERDRQGGMRVFPGVNLKGTTVTTIVDEPADVVDVVDAGANGSMIAGEAVVEVAAEPPIVDAEVAGDASSEDAGAQEITDVAAAGGNATERKTRKRRATAKTGRTPKPRAASTPKARSRKAPKAKAEAADASGQGS